MSSLLEVRDLSVDFRVRGRRLAAVDRVSFDVNRGETVGLVGESGSGKSTIALATMQVHQPSGGSIRFDGEEVSHAGGTALRTLRRRMQMVFQNPYASLDPRLSVRRILMEPLEAHGIGTKDEREAKVLDLLRRVGLGAEARDRYPAQFSGGQRQRIAIARALALSPELLILDEPVSALDVSIQAQVVNLLRDLQDELGIAYLIIAHDLPLVHQVSDRIAVLYLGRIVESGTADALVEKPLHPYTAALLSATPMREAGESRERIVLAGDPPSPIDRPAGCAFHPRCPVAESRCATESPSLTDAGDGRRVACHFPGRIPAPITLIR